MELLKTALNWIGFLAFLGAFIIPDYIAGVNKAMRLGKVSYPKEKRIKKWKWVGIFALTGLVAFGLFCRLDKFAA